MISKALKQRDLYHNPDPLGRLVEEANESKVIVEGQETTALLDSGSQLLSISWSWVNNLNFEPKQLQSILQIEGSGGLEVPYLGYVEVQLKIPEVKAFNHNVLLLIVPDSAHMQYTPITLETLHIDMAISPGTNGQGEHFNATLISMVGTLPSHAKKDWQEWITTLTHAYNCTVSSVMGFSPYFLMFGRNPKLPLDIDLGIPTIEQESTELE